MTTGEDYIKNCGERFKADLTQFGKDAKFDETVLSHVMAEKNIPIEFTANVVKGNKTVGQVRIYSEKSIGNKVRVKPKACKVLQVYETAAVDWNRKGKQRSALKRLSFAAQKDRQTAQEGMDAAKAYWGNLSADKRLDLLGVDKGWEKLSDREKEDVKKSMPKEDEGATKETAAENPIGLSEDDVVRVAEQIGIDWNAVEFTPADLHEGMLVELEHNEDPETDVVGSLEEVAKIAWVHLKETPEYYKKLEMVEPEGETAASWTAPQDLHDIIEGQVVANPEMSADQIVEKIKADSGLMDWIKEELPEATEGEIMEMIKQVVEDSITIFRREGADRVYVKPGEKAPSGYKLQQGPRGGQYYDTETPTEKKTVKKAPQKVAPKTAPKKVAKDEIRKTPLTQKEEDKVYSFIYDDVRVKEDDTYLMNKIRKKFPKNYISKTQALKLINNIRRDDVYSFIEDDVRLMEHDTYLMNKIRKNYPESYISKRQALKLINDIRRNDVYLSIYYDVMVKADDTYLMNKIRKKFPESYISKRQALKLINDIRKEEGMSTSKKRGGYGLKDDYRPNDAGKLEDTLWNFYERYPEFESEDEVTPRKGTKERKFLEDKVRKILGGRKVRQAEIDSLEGNNAHGMIQLLEEEGLIEDEKTSRTKYPDATDRLMRLGEKYWDAFEEGLEGGKRDRVINEIKKALGGRKLSQEEYDALEGDNYHGITKLMDDEHMVSHDYEE